MKNYTAVPLLMASLLGVSASGHAALVTQSFSGAFTFVDDAVVAGIPALGSISLSAPAFGSITYEDTLVATTGDSLLELDTAMQALSLTFGALNFTEADDVDYGFGFPSATFFDGDLGSIEFLHITGANGWDVMVNGTAFEIWDYSTPNDVLVAQGNFSYTVVPVPAAVWLFGSGLLGLAVVGRRKMV